MAIKVTGGSKEDGIVVGNSFDKYNSRNPIVNWMMKGFESALADFVTKAAPQSVHEVGCGEGYWTIRWNEQGLPARGCDFSTKVIDLAKENAADCGLSTSIFESRSIYDLQRERDSAELVVCCEVLEHLEFPAQGLEALTRIVTNHLIVSVPREPLWRSLNLIRGKYITTLGNTPGHIQHWSKIKFVNLISEYFDVIEIRSPLPWTMLLCRARKAT